MLRPGSAALAGIVAGIMAGSLLGCGAAPSPEPSCTLLGTPYQISGTQASHAATIAAVGAELGMSGRAVTIAFATALQESGLRNLPYGDRDSLGLFQQRPSQGWGTPEQVTDPRYAAAAFYDALAELPDWEAQRLTEAAQAVQRSGFPEAYQQWEPQAQALTDALLEPAAGLHCTIDEPVDPRAVREAALLAAVLADLGTAPTATRNGTLTWAAGDRPWMLANWLVAHADEFGLAAITLGGRGWTAEDGWADEPAVTATEITVQLA